MERAGEPQAARRDRLAGLAAFAAVGGLAAADGGFFPTSWGWAAFGLAGVAAAALVLVDRPALGPPELAFARLLVALVAWTALSAAWSRSLPESVLEAQRGLVYVAAAAAFLLAGRRRSVPWLLGGVLAATTAIALANLALRLAGRLEEGIPGGIAEPVGYENGLGVLSALGIVLAAGLAVTRHPGYALAIVPLAAALWPLESRASWLAVAVGLAAAAAGRAARVAVVAVGLAAVFLGGALLEGERSRYWGVAANQAESAPVLGTGAGTFGIAWLEQRPAALGARDAHSLYLETLAELGPVGLALLAAALAVPLLAGRDRLAGGAYAAFVVHAGADWDWELAAVGVAGLACGAALLLSARDERAQPVARGRALAASAVVAVLALAGLAGNTAIARAEEAVADRRWDDAVRHADRAILLAPWSDEARRARGIARRAQDRTAAARRSFRAAIDRDPSDVRNWRALVTVTDGRERAEALAAVRRLNPLAPR